MTLQVTFAIPAGDLARLPFIPASNVLAYGFPFALFVLAADLMMAILDGAVMPLVRGRVKDVFGANLAYVVPVICLALVAGYALFDLRDGHRGRHAVAGSAYA